jgi:DNA repair protein RecN (Recombination protein N)
VIQTLRVQNLAVIEELELDLGAGLNVLTGETGAGKSVLLSAVELLCGRRVTGDAIRSGCDEARVEALVTGERPLVRARSRGLASDEDEELLIVRTLVREGRGRVFVNGTPATVRLLGELMGDEIEITSQGEHQRLLRPEVQAELLDAFADLGDLVARVEEHYERWRALAVELETRRADSEERARREDQLRFELEQIERVDPEPGELERLERAHQRLAHVERLAERTQQALAQLDGEGAARERLAAAEAELRHARELDPELAEPAESLTRATVELDDAARALERYRAELESDPGELDRTDSRLAELGRLQSRYGSSVEAILAYRDQAREELDALGGGEERRAALEQEQAVVGEELGAAARALTQARLEAARALQQALEPELAALALGRAEFRVTFAALPGKTPEGWAAPSGPRGLERADFELSANPGEKARSLREAASGGELARLLLALRNALRDADAGGLLLFDEIDAGVGGGTAGRVGERLRRLARSHQILCITHLAPIAALAADHYRLEKRVRGGRTRTLARRVDGDARVDEIARMSGAGRVTEVARAHARELLGLS